MNSDSHRSWYEAGFADGQQAVLKVVSELLSTTAEIVPEGETRRIVSSLGAMIALMAPQTAETRDPTGRNTGL